ncbi:hypothetical protein DVS28_a1685 [Euzebya pacifica]|uniref:PH domain-containing protein n=1 Tax=Euzebya pacifica TaxID=1608957 RepID=A0A346XVX9_9ACTN|nr:hypothetical protein [Euzebya pacifica]AXV06376.1 hypothetical protein DVS28_a1685 [Euzebya pacifica]
MNNVVVLTRPLAMRVVAASTLVVIIAWAALSGDTSDFGVVAYPAIIGLQTAREFLWRLEVTAKGMHERPGIGPAREISWKAIDAVIMPNSTWWRINPVLKVIEGPNVQLTAADDVDAVIDMAVKKGKTIVGSADSVTLVRSIAPWILLLGLACLLLGAQLVGAAA